jgi:16S rRNA G1207 methylase RsmC
MTDTTDGITEDNDGDRIAPYPQESLLVDAVGTMSGERFLSTSPGLAQFAGAAAGAFSGATVSCLFLDAYRANLASEYWHDKPINLQIECASDFGDGPADVVALPLSAGGEAELARDLMQSGRERLKLGGKLYATSDKPDDTWLGEQLGKIFRKVERRTSPSGALYVGTKTEPLKKIKSYACEFAFRDRGRLIRAWSRPGVFSHRHIDTGARRLIDAMELEPGMRVLDIGCGAGTVALAAACRSPEAKVHAVDSHARAVECTARGALLNELTNLTTELNPNGNYRGAGEYDLALANPPYYSGFRIARHFLTAGHDALRPGGTLLLVTKHPTWYEQNMPRWYDEVTLTERKGYYLFQGKRPIADSAGAAKLPDDVL